MSTPFVSPAGDSLININETFLPIDQMRQVARVTTLNGPTIIAEVDLGEQHWVYRQHFPSDPIFPGTLIVEAAGQAVALWAWAQGQRGRPRLVRVEAEFHAPVRPDDPRLLIEAVVRRKRHLNFAEVTVRTARAAVATITAVLAVLPAAS